MTGHARLPAGHAGRRHLVDRPVAVTRGEVNGPHCVDQDAGFEAESGSIERRRLHAVIGGEAADDDPADVAPAEEAFELGRCRLAGDRVAHREPGVAVLAVGALADPRPIDDESRMELRAPRAGDTVDRPDAAVAGEVGRRFGVPVLGVDNERATGRRRRDLGVDRRQDRDRAGHAEAAGRVGEVVLDVDDDQAAA
jgi:hypothetical protein